MAEVSYSIIIPHFNSVDLLIKLLTTIPDTKDIEIIIVDDRSTVELNSVQEYILKRKNILFFINTVGKKGAGSCRNIGLSKASGKWLIFADADDYFLPGWKQIIDEYLDFDAEMIYFVPYGIDLKTGNESKRHHIYQDLVNSYIDFPTLENKVKIKSGFCTPWSKMIRRTMVEENGILFDEILASNDIMFITKCAFASKKIFADKKMIYCVTRGGNSLTSKKDKEKFLARVDVVIRRYKYLEKILSKKEFEYAHIDRYALARLADSVFQGWGISTFLYIIKLYIKNGVKFFDIQLLNPITFIKLAKYELGWWLEIKNVKKTVK